MKKKLPTPVKDGLIGAAIGSAIIVPGISGGTIALIFGAYKKIIKAVDDMLKKDFWRNFLLLVPFLVGAIISIAILYFPFKLAFKYCMFAIVCLFGGFILGSLPGVFDEVKGVKIKKSNIFQLFLGFAVALSVGILSIFFGFNSAISALFSEVPFYLYFIIFGVGIIGSTGLVVPGFSGSMLLLVIGFYKPIMGLISFDNFLVNASLIFTFAVGILVGVILFSKLMNTILTNHKIATMYVVIGFIIGSLISIFANGEMISYFSSQSFGLLDKILGPILLIFGVALSYYLTLLKRRHLGEQNAEN